MGEGKWRGRGFRGRVNGHTATTSLAPCSMSVLAAFAKVPHVSAISSTRIQVLFTTFPTSTILETSFGRARSLWMMANWRSRRSAIEAALQFC